MVTLCVWLNTRGVKPLSVMINLHNAGPFSLMVFILSISPVLSGASPGGNNDTYADISIGPTIKLPAYVTGCTHEKK